MGARDREAREATLERWREIDRRLNLGELSPEEAVTELFSAGLVRKENTFANRVRVDGFVFPARLVLFEPAREHLIPGPVILRWGNLYGGRRLYYPISGDLRWDTGPYSVGPWPWDESSPEEMSGSREGKQVGRPGVDQAPVAMPEPTLLREVHS